MALIEIRNLTKRWSGGKLALDEVSFDLRQGEILGLLGHNGAGKSTVLGITLGMVRPDGGEVRVAGQSVQRERASALRQVGAIYEAAAFYDYLTAWQNLRVLCSLSGWWDEAEVKRVLKLVKLEDRAHHFAGKLVVVHDQDVGGGAHACGLWRRGLERRRSGRSERL